MGKIEMHSCKRLVRAGRIGIGLMLLGILTGCGGYGYYGYGEPGWYGPDYDDYDYGPGFYGDVWGADAYVFRHHDHGRFDA